MQPGSSGRALFTLVIFRLATAAARGRFCCLGRGANCRRQGRSIDFARTGRLTRVGGGSRFFGAPGTARCTAGRTLRFLLLRVTDERVIGVFELVSNVRNRFGAGFAPAFTTIAIFTIIAAVAATARLALPIFSDDIAFVIVIRPFTVAIVVTIIPAATRFILARLVIGDHPEIMVRELQVIFGLHPVAIMLSILSQLLVFIEKLGCVATRPAVDPVRLITATALIAVAATTATVVIVAIGVQGQLSSLRSAAAGPSPQQAA